MMKYKGYYGNVEFDNEARVFHGRVLNIKDIVNFEGTSVEEIEKAFSDSVDDYLDWCKEEEMEPNRPYSGKFMIRTSPDLHERISVLAEKEHLSLNRYINKIFENETAQV